MRLLRAAVFRRCALAGSPPALERRRIAAPRLRTRHRGEIQTSTPGDGSSQFDRSRCLRAVSKREISQKLSKGSVCFRQRTSGPLGHKMGSFWRVEDCGRENCRLQAAARQRYRALVGATPAWGGGLSRRSRRNDFPIDGAFRWSHARLGRWISRPSPLLLANCCASAWTLCSARPRRDVGFGVTRHNSGTQSVALSGLVRPHQLAASLDRNPQ